MIEILEVITTYQCLVDVRAWARFDILRDYSCPPLYIKSIIDAHFRQQQINKKYPISIMSCPLQLNQINIAAFYQKNK